ncbi:MAG: membrane protein insertion efficiency factor YidD [Hydrogenovibrio sp.]|nr:membrane protein insertion efficiency factor YidD [Hydrogenovibrio sp.]
MNFYHWVIIPVLGPRCRFFPSCSHSRVEAIDHLGVFCGSWLGFKRIIRCHPGNDGGVDLVPECGCGRSSDKPKASSKSISEE